MVAFTVVFIVLFVSNCFVLSYTANICMIFHIHTIFFIEFIYHSDRWRLYHSRKHLVYNRLREKRTKK